MRVEQVFSGNLRKYRSAKKLSQVQLAEMVDLGRKAISDYEVGRTEPSFEIVGKLAQALDIPPSALFGTGAGAAPSNPRAKLVNRVNGTLTRLSDGDLARIAKMLESFTGG